MKEYPLFIPPPSIASGIPREWSKKQADEYLAWIQESLNERVNGLLAYFNQTLGEPRQLLTRMGHLAADAFSLPEFSSDGKLTNRGYAMAADLGLLVAKLLLEAGRGIRWDIVRKPKREASYNQPVLAGINTPGTFNPIAVSIADACWNLAGKGDGDEWLKVYEWALERAIG